jgi:hypothetical protein
MRSNGVSHPERLRLADAICHLLANPKAVIFTEWSGSTEGTEARVQTSD